VTEWQLPEVAMRPFRWGAQDVALPEAAAPALAALGVHAPAHGPVDPTAIELAQSALPDDARAALEQAVGADHVSTASADRIAHTRGWSTPDLLKLRAGDATDAPDAIVFPGSHDEVVRVLEVCTQQRIAVVPFAGGTSVVGGLVAARGGFTAVIALDVQRLDSVTGLDEVSRTVTLGTGLRATAAEAVLNQAGYTLGHFPQSYEGASIGGYAAARSAGQSSAGYGRFDEMVVGMVVATPRGTLRFGTAPRSAAGPDLRQLVLGSEGTLGVITAVTVRLRPRPAERVFEGWRFDSFDAGAAAVRRLAQDGPLPTVLRLSDEAETAINLADPDVLGNGAGGCLAVTGYEGTAADVAARRSACSAVLTEAGGVALGAGPGEAWRTGRFRAPYLRDPLLDAGAFVETLETASFWSNLSALRSAVSSALTESLGAQGTPAVVLCHISHVYETGASLYFTVLCAQTDDPLGQWHEAKQAATAAIRAVGGTVSHHHGVGTDHRAAYHDEVGPLAIELLRAVKATVDPAGILNPGVLVG
jgi:alkyldihydroxyacetonephosphate synthase